MRNSKFQKELKQTLAQISGQFTSHDFSKAARANGVDQHYIDCGGVGRFLQQHYLVKRLSPMKWVKKEKASEMPSPEITVKAEQLQVYDFNIISDSVLIDECKRRGWKVLIPQFKEA